MTSLLRRYRLSLGIFIFGLVVSGLTALPLLHELRLAARLLGITDPHAYRELSGLAHWIGFVLLGLEETHARFPFLAYGTDWLGFGHLCVAIFFIRPFVKPVENNWVLQCGLVCCATVIPFAFVAGHYRGIPIYWRLIDSSFGILWALPLLYCLHLTRRMHRMRNPPEPTVTFQE